VSGGGDEQEWPGARATGRRGERPPLFVGLGNFLFKTRDLVFPILVLAVAFGATPVVPASRTLGTLLNVAGIVLASAGQILRAVVIGFAYITRGGRNRKVYAERLVQEGVFAHCRNPLYVGNILIVAGLAVVHGSPWFYGVVIPFFVLAYYAIVRAEEDYLGRTFGAVYDDYCRRVNRFIVSPVGLGSTLAGLSFDGKKLLRKEYGTTYAWTTGILALLARERLQAGSPGGARGDVSVLVAIWVALTVAYLCVRVAKKRGLLGSG
jgi:protein-S-isoprenylcysteine O-methyltransferase Ste14